MFLLGTYLVNELKTDKNIQFFDLYQSPILILVLCIYSCSVIQLCVMLQQEKCLQYYWNNYSFIFPLRLPVPETLIYINFYTFNRVYTLYYYNSASLSLANINNTHLISYDKIIYIIIYGPVSCFMFVLVFLVQYLQSLCCVWFWFLFKFTPVPVSV